MLLAFVGLEVGEPEKGGGGVGFVGELAELLAVGLEPAVEGEAEDAFDAEEVAAAVRDLGAAERDGASTEVLDVDDGCGGGGGGGGGSGRRRSHSDEGRDRRAWSRYRIIVRKNQWCPEKILTQLVILSGAPRAASLRMTKGAVNGSFCLRRSRTLLCNVLTLLR